MACSEASSQNVRVRFAPSPTGNLHLGGARTALFNWLFARHCGGRFLLRIEDTDRERSRREYTREIIDSLNWLGICHDEIPCFQSRRGRIYRDKAASLVTSGRAYFCFCSQAELEERRREAVSDGRTFRYDGRCASLGVEELKSRLDRKDPAVVRIRMPEGISAWSDILRGEISFDNRQFDDFIILKSDGSPTYHFAVVVDDIDMNITHVIRGDDHISNTPRQLAIYDALRKDPPAFAHIPMIHGGDGRRLSKRHGATAVLEYRKMGFLPSALVNYLALLGWSPGDDREIMSVDEIVSLFDLKRVVRTPAVFDIEKLTWMNGIYIGSTDVEQRIDLLMPYWIEAGLLEEGDDTGKREWLREIVETVGDRLKVLPDIIPYTDFLFREKIMPDDKAAAVLRKAAKFRDSSIRAIERLEALPEFARGPIEEAMRGLAEEENLSAGGFFKAVRAAISGKLATPGLFECMELLGRRKTLGRMRGWLVGETPPEDQAGATG